MADFSFCLRLQRWLFTALLLILSLFKMLVCCSSWIASILIFLKHCINIILILIAGLFDAPLNATPEARARSPYPGHRPAIHSHSPAVGVHSLLWQQLFCTGNQEKVSSSSCSWPLFCQWAFQGSYCSPPALTSTSGKGWFHHSGDVASAQSKMPGGRWQT